MKVEKNQTMEQGGLKMKARGLKNEVGCLRLISQEEGEEDVQSKAEKKEDTASLRLKER